MSVRVVEDLLDSACHSLSHLLLEYPRRDMWAKTARSLVRTAVSKLTTRYLLFLTRSGETHLRAVPRPEILKTYVDDSGRLLLALTERTLLYGKKGVLTEVEIISTQRLVSTSGDSATAEYAEDIWQVTTQQVESKLAVAFLNRSRILQIDVFYQDIPPILVYDQQGQFLKAYPELETSKTRIEDETE